jgi:outer membrane lipoprotein-sorting protein
MKTRLAIALTAGIGLGAGVLAAADSLDDVLARMDSAAKEFQSYSATVKRVDYTKVLDSTDDSSGAMRLKRGKNGIVGIMDTTAGPDHTVVHFNGLTVERYLPKAATVEQYNAKKFASTMDEMLLLGFAVTRADLKQNYDIKLLGADTVDGTQTSHILLTPKSPEALKYVKTIDLWINATGNAIRQKGTEPTGNYKLATFSDLKVNPRLPDAAFDLTVPKGTKTVKEN